MKYFDNFISLCLSLVVL